MPDCIPRCIPRQSVIVMISLVLGMTFFAESGAIASSAKECNSTQSLAKSSGTVIPEFDASSFEDEIENPFMPLEPGALYIYRSFTKHGVEVVEEFVTSAHKMILGVSTTVVRNREMIDGVLVEETFDWYAQDKDGNVWYFGEDSKKYKDGRVVSTEGSWEAGANGAKPGIIMPSNPRVGDEYPQERAPGVAEDMAHVIGISESVSVPFGSFEKCLKTLEFDNLKPEAKEHKYFARGVGLVLETDQNGEYRVELISVIGIDDDDDDENDITDDDEEEDDDDEINH